MMKFYMTPGSCTTGIHILLEELGLLFEVRLVNLPRGDHKTPEFLALNPKSSIPVLELDDGRALTEFGAIAWWLARSYPKAGLLSDKLDDEVHILEMMEYVVGTLHMQGFARIFTTDSFTANAADHDAVKQRGREIIDACFTVIDGQLADSGYVVECFSIADVALFYNEFWAAHLGIPLPPRCQAHYQLMLSRPSVKQILMEEGYGYKVA